MQRGTNAHFAMIIIVVFAKAVNDNFHNFRGKEKQSGEGVHLPDRHPKPVCLKKVQCLFAKNECAL